MNWVQRQLRFDFIRSVSEALKIFQDISNNDNEHIKEEIQFENNQNIDNDSNISTYQVLWTKPSNRKKRTWEGDGKLEIKINNAILYDENGVVLSTSSAPAEQLLFIGSIFSVGSKEVELIEKVENNCKILVKSLENNVKSYNKNKKRKLDNKIERPLCNGIKKFFSTRSAETFILPPPPFEHQWKYNTNKKPITEVRVDNFLSLNLRPHQREGLQFLYECVMGYKNHYTGAILADEMGLGKSLQCIALIWMLLKHGPYGMIIAKRVLVITPSTLCTMWQQEFAKWLGRERMQVFVVDNSNKVISFNSQRNCPVMIISYERLVKNIDDIEKIGFDLIICDEAHRLKNSNIKTVQSLDRLGCNKRVLLTGTPFQNDLQEYFTLSNIANPGVLGTYAEFKEQFEEPILYSQNPNCSEEELQIGEEQAVSLNFLTSTFILRRTQSILENLLPTKTEYVICCELTNLQKKVYSIAINEWWNNKENFQTLSPLGFIIVLKKICNHLLLLYTKDNINEENSFKLYNVENFINSNKITLKDSSKLQVLQELLKNTIANNEKMVIVSSSTQMLNILGDRLKEMEIGYLRLDGNTPLQQRQQIVNNFNMPISKNYISDKNMNVLLLSSRAGGVGLSLPGASHLILYDSDWNPAIDNQAMARIWREGQKKPVHLYRLLSTGTIEEKIYQRQIYKTGLSDTVLHSLKSKSLKLNESDLKDLFSYISDSKSSTHDLIQCNCMKIDYNEIDLNTSQKSDDELFSVIDFNKPVKNCSINQLKMWDHFESPFTDEFMEEIHTTGAKEFITFVFRKIFKHQ